MVFDRGNVTVVVFLNNDLWHYIVVDDNWQRSVVPSDGYVNHMSAFSNGLIDALRPSMNDYPVIESDYE